MENLNSIMDPLTTIDEQNIEYLDLFDYPNLIYGNLNFSSARVDFCKYPLSIQKEMNQFGNLAIREMKNLNSAACGNRLQFSTDSNYIILKIQLKRKWGYQKMVNWNASGFDVYSINNEEYVHETVFGPSDGHSIFAERIKVPKSGNLCIYLPNYNTIQKMFIGIEKESKIKTLNYPENKQLPILFYGNSVTQGAAASKSGNSFPNIISRKLNRNIINLSCSSCCRGLDSIAELIGQINCHTIILDYTRNAYTTEIFDKTHEKFYQKIRVYHPNTKIILLTSACFNHWLAYDDFDIIVERTYKNALERNENVKLLNQRSLFDDDEYSYVAIDSSHYTDYGMFKVAEALCNLINE